MIRLPVPHLMPLAFASGLLQEYDCNMFISMLLISPKFPFWDINTLAELT